ncbi:MAG: 2-oxo acid dehydrogenase subunit E2 [Solirubrobacterales bacterium]
MAEVREAVVPDIGDFTDVPVVEILVSPGDKVEAETPLVTLESDKASMDVPAPFAGVVEKVLVSVGDTVSEGMPLVALSTEDAGGEDGQPSGSEAAKTAMAEPADTSAESEAPAPAASGNGAAAAVDGQPSPPSPSRAAGPAYAGPGARRRARELGVDLSRLTGTGRKGRIIVSDVESATSGGGARAGIGGLELPPWPEVDFAKHGPVERQPLPKIKQIAGPNLQRNWVTIPHVTHNDEADITELEAFRVRSNEKLAEQGVKLTMVGLLLKACVASLKEFPEFNSSLQGDSLILKRYYHLGFAADTPQGLVVPVIRNVDSKDLVEIAGELRELSGKAREGKLGPAQMSGGTFTISSLGGIGGTGFTPIVNAPEVAILGVTRSARKPVWTDGEFVPRLMLPLSLSYDHRVIDGAAAARFCVHLAGVLSDLKPGFA